jgi:uncharacterized protein YxjI
LTQTPPADEGPGWYPDPWGKHEHRYFNGDEWTEHVASHGRQSIDPPTEVGGPVPTVDRSLEKIRRDVANAGVVAEVATGTGNMLDEPVLVVNQKAKVIEMHNEYAIYDQNGEQVGAVREVGQSTTKKVIRVVSSFDQFMTHKLQVVDMEGNVLLALTRPAKFMKSRVIVEDGTGRPLGEVAQRNLLGKIRFDMMAGGVKQGSINAENWRAWNFNIADAQGNEIARVTKTWEGLAKTMFTTADNYVVNIHRELPEPLRSLVVASALCIDTALKQDNRGLS